MSQSSDLFLPDSDKALHERLALAIEGAIANGLYPPGARLPTHRHLARQFSVSIGTVTRAIDALSARGVVRGEIGRGTFVGANTGAESEFIDLTINAPPPLLGHERLSAAASIATRQALALPQGGYVDHSGTERQRTVVAQWLSETRLNSSADDIVLCSGAQQGLHLAFAALRSQSTSIASEGVSFPGAIAAAANLGLTMLPVAYDDEGMLPDALDKVLTESGCRIIYTTPVCQNPLGFETGPERRRVLATVAAKHGAAIVEDDIYGLYAAKGGLTYKQLAPETTFFITSLSKSVTPLVRLGVLVPPRAHRTAIVRRLRAESWGLPPYVVELAAALIETGAAADTAALLRVEAKARLDLARAILGLAATPMPNGAPHIWLDLSPLKAEQLARRSSEAGVRITPPGAMQVGEPAIGGVRICIMTPPSRPILERGLGVLAGLLSSDEQVVI
ncbi:hypothetical protein VW29_04880 [Devosia limi DSM 17137]|uniref:DNA-binding transcriptional regulator, MocR family, contains an aminotransferase domain n=1 Tax=Devosia limi DSM 17137 TaxID=1121477 RepID=A0A0F5LUU3_9HYPH|nr:PLP-dependent aminotransferase family protein [Devosia limi]KKB85944.1 hypothetical protein VW29_04880 [Devosia limi DSM 17137]SHF01049.1 DNA-binding transcriptional regulator, MocR family, contains an aminotransferase domain [Devosia limi DSM 17137]